ncbi:hypothetical protein HYU94_03370 [Candidatus Daviesbacteria bacterium]|nr:hypothetical protein [Candidatus Daviesbacteria bacterium]
MSAIEFIQRFREQKIRLEGFRHPAVVVFEFGGGNCNRAGSASCKDFCGVPKGKEYDPTLDPSLEMLEKQFQEIALLKPAVVSIVPNGEAVRPDQEANTTWGDVAKFSLKQSRFLMQYYSEKYNSDVINQNQALTSAEKIAVAIALGKNAGLNLSLTTNGNLLDRDLLVLYRKMGLECMNLSYHPPKPFNPERYDPYIEHLIKIANQAIEVGIIPTITHVLTRQNAGTFVALADYVTGQDIFFAVGIANAPGGGFSVNNPAIEPTENQVKMVFRRLLARKLFADRHIRTTIPYLLMAPYLRHWICDQTPDFLHVSIEKSGERLQPQLNVCSEIRSKTTEGCDGCTHQCFFEAQTRGTIGILERNDWWDTFGKAARQRYTFRHPIRPIVSEKTDFQNPYLWGSVLQGISRVTAGLKEDTYWKDTFKRSGVDFETLLDGLIKDATDSQVINELVQAEKKDAEIKIWRQNEVEVTKRSPIFTNWHDAGYLQSRFLRSVYLQLQESGKYGIAVPLKFRNILRHEEPNDFRTSIETILRGKREEQSKFKGILQIISNILSYFIPKVFEVSF